MISTNPEWDIRNIDLAKKPIYAFTISGQTPIYTTHDLTCENITGTLPGYRPWLKTPRGATQSVDILAGSSSIGELECEIIDQDGALRTLVGSTDLEGSTVTLAVGYPGIACSNFVVLHTYTLYKILPARNYTGWLFRARDNQLKLKRTVYQHPNNSYPLDESNPLILQGTPAEIFQALYFWALNRPVAELDRSILTALDAATEGLYNTVRPFWFQLTEAFEVKQFLESEIFKPAGLYPVIDNLGRLSLRSFRPPAAGPNPVFTFSADNMVMLPEIDRMPILNEIVFKLDDYGDGPQTQLVYIEATSLSTYGRAGQHVIQSKGLRTVLGAQAWCEELANRLFRRFAGTPAALRGGAPVLRIEAFLLTLPVWLGDYVYLSHPLMPDILTGAKGLTNRLFEVIDREPDFAAGRMRYRLLDTGLTGLQAAHNWAPSGRDFVIEQSEIY